MGDCKFLFHDRVCGLPLRTQYPGLDPENGPARPFCPEGHSQCIDCEGWASGWCELCDACLAKLPCDVCQREVANPEHPDGVSYTDPDPACPACGPCERCGGEGCVTLPFDEYQTSERIVSCPECHQPEWCHECGEEIAPVDLVNVHVEDCGVESGPTGRFYLVSKHRSC
jgi:hypothetical protein